MKDPTPKRSPVPLPTAPLREEPKPWQRRMAIEEKGTFVQGAPKMYAEDFRGQSVESLQTVATQHSQQHGATVEGMTDVFHDLKDQTQEVDYERNV